jgi:hypothetical protein
VARSDRVGARRVELHRRVTARDGVERGLGGLVLVRPEAGQGMEGRVG